MRSPYENRPARSFWRTGVADVGGEILPDLYIPKVVIDKTMPIATAGSVCEEALLEGFAR